MRRVSLLELQALKEEKGDFILYVRSDRARERIREVFLRYGHLVGVYDVFLSLFVEVL